MDKALFKKLVRSLSELVRIPSVASTPEEGAPFGKECKRALDYALKLGKRLGFPVARNMDGYLGYLECGEGEEIFGILCHLDVVPEGEGWSVPPYCGEIIDGKLFGRGSGDDKGPSLAAVFATAQLLKEGFKPKKRIRIIFGCDEETGGGDKSGWTSIDHYAESEPLPQTGFSPDADFPVINCEKGMLHLALSIPAPIGLVSVSGGTRVNIVPNFAEAMVTSGTNRNYRVADSVSIRLDGERLDIKARGTSVHAAYADRGDNAIVKLFTFLADNDLDGYGYIADLFRDACGAGFELALSDRVSGKLTMNLGKVDLTDDRLTFVVDIRYPVSYKADYIISQMKKYWRGDVAVLKNSPPLYVAPTNPLVETLLNSYNKVTGDNATPIAIGGGTYARALPCAVAFGANFPNDKCLAHESDEYISLDSLQKTYDIYYDAIKTLCF